MKLLTTGQAAGYTKLPVKTIQRYIRDHPEAFSERAKQPQKGRRYTAQDVKNLLVIRHLSQARESREKIRDALAGKWTPESMPMIEIENIFQIAQIAEQATAESKGHAARAQNERLILEGNLNWVKKTIRQMKETIEEHEKELYRLRQLVSVMAKDKHQAEAKTGW